MKISMPYQVKHGGSWFAPCKPFEIDEHESGEFIARGAKVLEPSHKSTESAPVKSAPKSRAAVAAKKGN